MKKNKPRISSWKTFGIIVWFVIVLLGCNLGTTGDVAPPTLVPRPSATPPPTLGYSGSVQTGSGAVDVSNPGTPVGDIDRDLFNLMEQVSRDRLMAHVDALQGFGTRHVNSEKTSSTRGIGAARQYIRSQFEQISAESNGRLVVSEDPFTARWDNQTTQQHNVFGYIGGTQAGASTIVVGAHYDSVGDPELTDAETFAPGANDNATGVAALLELARIMSNEQYRSTIIFVAFSAEEVGRQGSKAFVDFLQSQNIDLVGMVNIDSIGNANSRSGAVNDEELRVFSAPPNDTSPSRQLARTAEFLSFAHDAKLLMRVEDAADRENRYGDHFSFSEAGYPAIRFINVLEEKANADPSDTIEFIEPAYLREATQSILLIITTLADGPLPPNSITLRANDNDTQTLRWNEVPGANGYVVALRRAGSLRYDNQIPVSNTFVTWDRFDEYAAISIAARGPNGMIGRLSDEYKVR